MMLGRLASAIRARSLLTPTRRQLSVAAAPAEASTMRWAVGGWSFFIVENVVLSENRARVIALLGDDERESRYHALYGSLSTAAAAW